MGIWTENESEKLIIENEEAAAAFGSRLASDLKRGSVVALVGDLGTGKTTLTKAIAAGLGIEENVTSPTFTIVHEYHSGRLPLYHFDVYRLSSSEDMEELGYEEYFFGDGVCVIEWADIIMDIIPRGSMLINIEYGSEPNQRIYNISHV